MKGRLLTKAINAPTAEQHMQYITGQAEIPLPDGVKVWFGPPDKPVLRGNLVPPTDSKSTNGVRSTVRSETANVAAKHDQPAGSSLNPYDLTIFSSSSDDEDQNTYSEQVHGPGVHQGQHYAAKPAKRHKPEGNYAIKSKSQLRKPEPESNTVPRKTVTFDYTWDNTVMFNVSPG